MSKKPQPKSVEIRSYQVGFGDCFLLSFVYGAQKKRHVLIDFGTTALPKTVMKRDEHMAAVAHDIATACGGRLDAVVATHRHADHVSGFATTGKDGGSGAIIKSLRPRVIVQPWTEDPKAARDATSATKLRAGGNVRLVGELAAMNDIAAYALRLVRERPGALGARARRQLEFLGEDNIKNESAVRNLIAMGKAKGAKAEYLRYRAKSAMEKVLPGVRVTVLGPPDLTQTDKIRKMAKKHPDEFWLRLAGPGGVAHGAARALRVHPGTPPPESRWFRDRLDRIGPAQILEIVRTLDEQMNNTSLILLFEVGRKKLLFPGDAQLENWTYALEDAPEAKKNRALLADVDVYKVGHHGSLNATPRRLFWDGLTRKSKNKNAPGRLQSILSTMPGKHGSTHAKTEVPRRTLQKALDAETTLHDTTTLKKNELCRVVTVRSG